MNLSIDPLPLSIIQRYKTLKSFELESLLETEIRFIAIPIPPSPVRGLLYNPYSYVSETFDNVFEKDPGENRKGYRCVAMLPTNQGPAFYITAPLRTLINLDFNKFLNRHRVSVSSSAFCAAIEFDELNLGKNEGSFLIEGYADKVRLLSMSLVSRSCHGGSHLIVPGAPYLTALLQINSAPGDTIFFQEELQDKRVAARYGRPWIEETGALFPEVNWDRNTSVDMLISESYVERSRYKISDEENTKGKTLSLQDIIVFPHRECVGRWAHPFLKTFTHNILTPLGESNGCLAYYSRVRNDFEEVDLVDSTSEVGNTFCEGLSIDPC
jgi:hypothetical protein